MKVFFGFRSKERDKKYRSSTWKAIKIHTWNVLGTPASLVVESGNAEVVMAEIRSANNATFYNSAAWVRANSTIDSLTTMLNGNYISSHTSATGTAGTVMPLGTLINEGFIETQADDDTETVDNFISDISSLMEKKGVEVDKEVKSYTLFDDAAENE